ncbi:MAG: hypothetical protein WB818_05325, partial [Desulfobacterales bacterium]
MTTNRWRNAKRLKSLRLHLPDGELDVLWFETYIPNCRSHEVVAAKTIKGGPLCMTKRSCAKKFAPSIPI